jgi:hypothetical protein
MLAEPHVDVRHPYIPEKEQKHQLINLQAFCQCQLQDAVTAPKVGELTTAATAGVSRSTAVTPAKVSGATYTSDRAS